MSLTFIPTPIPGNGNKLVISKRREASIEAAAACLKDKRDYNKKKKRNEKHEEMKCKFDLMMRKSAITYLLDKSLITAQKII